MNGIPCLAALYMGVWGSRGVRNLFARGLSVFMLGGSRIQRIGHTVVFALAEVVHQQIACNRGHPGHERALAAFVRVQGAVHLDKDLLGEVLGVVGIAREAIADVVNPPMMALD